MIAVHELELVAGHQEYAGVAVELALPRGIVGRMETELQMDTRVAVGRPGRVVSFAAGHHALLVERPVRIAPLGSIENGGLGRRLDDALFD